MVKTLTIKETTYHRLVALKHSDESFSNLLDRLAARRSLEALRKMRSRLDLRTGEREDILAELRKKREESRRR